MKYVLLLITAATILFSACTQPKVSEMLKNEMQKKEIFSVILSDADLSSELMDSLMNTHHQMTMMKIDVMMKRDNISHQHLMETMMNMADNDSVLRAKMVGMMFKYPHLRNKIMEWSIITQKLDNTRVDMSGHIPKTTK